MRYCNSESCAPKSQLWQFGVKFGRGARESLVWLLGRNGSKEEGVDDKACMRIYREESIETTVEISVLNLIEK